MDSISPGPLSRRTSIAAAMIVSVKPEAFWNSGCIAFKVKQGPNEGTEKNDSVISVCSCSKPSGVVIRFLEFGLAELAPPSWPCRWLISEVPAQRFGGMARQGR